MAKSGRRRERERKTRRHSPAATPKPLGFRRARAVEAFKRERDHIEIAQDRRWFIVQTFPTYEMRVQQHFERAGLCEVFRPIESVRRARRGRSYTTHRHLMPRHMFVGLLPGQDPRVVVRDVQGVFDVLRINGRDVEIRAEELQEFANVICDKIGPLRGIGKQVMQAGDPVLVVKGPFKSFPAVVLRPARNGMIALELKLFGRTETFDAPLDHLLAAE